MNKFDTVNFEYVPETENKLYPNAALAPLLLSGTNVTI